MTTAGWIGVVLLIAGSAAILLEAVVAGLWVRRISVRSRLMAHAMQTERGLIQADVMRLQRALDETALLWQPYGRALRWLRHPLIVALIESFIRRRRTA